MEQKNSVAEWVDRYPLLVIIGSLTVWFVISCIAFKQLDPYGDMIEAFSFTPHYELGTFKHPPLSGWVARLWFSLLPKTISSFHLLCVLCSLISSLGVYELAKAYLPREKVALAMVALTLTLPYTSLAFKFNANSILMPIWPWVVVFYRRSLHSAHWRAPVAMGVLAALGMLGKYYTATLLAGIFIASFCTEEGRNWIKSRRPWLALLAFMLTLLPHLIWLVRMGAPTIDYINQHHVDAVDWKHIAIFYLSPYLYGAFGLASILYATPRGLRRAALTRMVALNIRDELFWIGHAPILITIVFALLKIKPTLHWAIPLLYIYPIYWCRLMARMGEVQMARVKDSVPLVWLLSVVMAVVFTVKQAESGSADYYQDDRRAAEEIVKRHDMQFPSGTLAWVGGAWPDAGIIPFYTNRQLVVFPGLPDRSPVTRMEPVRWRGQDGVFICKPSDSDCIRTAMAWLGRMKLPANRERVCTHPVGFWFPRRVESCYDVLWYHPGGALDGRPPYQRKSRFQ